ncbi:hypothetical protein [uncultured Xylophilus sp.]|uniref:hypothetical protein n=1 Tax=uncultured Xylophilus sp. TaxID=296832 RepID=UPI0025FCB46A|nr:hypothetical protein [uncultured Xylophilus sp.]
MSTLSVELLRLYPPPPSAGTVRHAVLAVAQPAPWSGLSAVWRGVQADLGLPAPAIAVSGADTMQLWFSFAVPAPVAQVRMFLAGLQARYLGDVPARLVRLWPQAADGPDDGTRPPLPPRQVADDQWSAFVAPDLAPVFEDTPWLDIPPGDDGQAAQLRGLRAIAPASFEAALPAPGTVLPAGRAAPLDDPAPAPAPAAARAAPATESGLPAEPATADAAHDAARRFLLQAMHDPEVPMALRIDAAKALLATRERS